MSEKEEGGGKKGRRAGYIAAIIANIILFYIFNNVLDWEIPYLVLTPNFTDCLWAINLSIGAAILGNIFLIVYDPRWFRHLIKMILNIFVFIAFYTVYTIFPFSLTQEIFLRTVLIFLMVVTVIAFIVEFYKLIFNKD